MAVNKVVYDGTTLIDLTGDTVTEDTLLVGTTAHDASGEQITGTMTKGASLNIIETFEKFQATSTVKNGNVITSTDGSGNKLVSTINGSSVSEVYTATDGTTITRTSVVNGNGVFTDTYTSSDGTTMTKVTTIDSNGNANYTYN